MDTLIKKAYENWNQVVEYDGKSLVSFKQNKRSGVSRNDFSAGSIEYPNLRSSINQLMPLRLPVVGSSESASVDSNLLVGGNKYFLIYLFVYASLVIEKLTDHKELKSLLVCPLGICILHM